MNEHLRSEFDDVGAVQTQQSVMCLLLVENRGQYLASFDGCEGYPTFILGVRYSTVKVL